MTSHEETQFDATDEAFFNAADDEAPVSEAPVTLELEAQEPENQEEPAGPVVSERLRARRTRLTQAVVEIVSALALVPSLALGMGFVRSNAASSARAAAASHPRPQQGRPLYTVENPRVVASRPTGDSAAGSQTAIRHYRPAAGTRVTPGS